ncbi:hypothetical protein B7453_10445 [Pseudomonas sp. IB20]|nr:hypothetical protein B7453_10445 [Pseudomonas sp. IB20]
MTLLNAEYICDFAIFIRPFAEHSVMHIYFYRMLVFTVVTYSNPNILTIPKDTYSILITHTSVICYEIK